MQFKKAFVTVTECNTVSSNKSNEKIQTTFLRGNYKTLLKDIKKK